MSKLGPRKKAQWLRALAAPLEEEGPPSLPSINSMLHNCLKLQFRVV